MGKFNMSTLKDIIRGHYYEATNKFENLSLERMKICKNCPLYAVKLGQEVCNSSLYLNPETGGVSRVDKEGYIQGCGCRLQAKTTIPEMTCPAGKW